MGLSQETDENLMLRFGRGEAAAFEFLYQRHESRVFRYLHRNVRNKATANDLMQEVWFAVVRGAANYQPTAKFTTWLFTIAHNRTVDMIRANHRLQSLDAGVASKFKLVLLWLAVGLPLLWGAMKALEDIGSLPL